MQELVKVTFRMNVTPSSKRMPRLGDVELQRRKQSPSSRAGRMPVIWSQHTKTKDKFVIFFSSSFQGCRFAKIQRQLEISWDTFGEKLQVLEFLEL